MPAPLPVALGYAAICVASAWFGRVRDGRSVSPPKPEQELIESEVANGWTLRKDAVPATLSAAERRRFALVPNESYMQWSRDDNDSAEWHGIVAGRVSGSWQSEDVRSPWAVWTTNQLLSSEECAAWVKRAEELELETGDFVFAGGSWGLSRLHTGARRHSSTRMVVDPEFAALMKLRLKGKVPTKLADGRLYGGVGSNFLVSKYVAGQYFAPHFDGRGSGGFYLEGHVSEFTVVLYLSDDFVGGETHYLEGQGSEVNQSVALRPGRGCAVIHRQGTVLHSGGALHEGVKYIMQFFLYYEAPSKPEPRPLTNLRWGA